MKTNLTEFQREFRRAREAADRGESVIIEAGERRYVFEVIGEARNPFEGLEDVFGAVNLGVKKGRIVIASAKDWPRNIVVDSGVLVAAIDVYESDHPWAKRVLTTLRGTFFTCEACITEAVHLLGNSAPAVTRLSRLVESMSVISFASGEWQTALADVVRRSPIMDYADACIVNMVTERRGSFALTLDYRDFSTYRIPFASPEGELLRGMMN